jgi:phosphatidylethanolamine N-methyltransferase
MLLSCTYDIFFWNFTRLAVRVLHKFSISSAYTQIPSFTRALKEQPTIPMLPEPYATNLTIVLFLTGQLFVISSTWALGITGTFLGDYFGILMDHRVEGFPFNVLRDPMYVGSTMCFAATALWYESPAGLLITLYVYIVYTIALRYEG